VLLDLPPTSKERQPVDVEIPQLLRDTVAQFGAGAPYALKAVAGQLADDPDMGRPSTLPGILTVTVDGDQFEDCPDLAIGYIREPDWIQIRYVSPISSTEPTEPTEPTEAVEPTEPSRPAEEAKLAAAVRGKERARPADPAADAVTVRQVADAWRRVTGWLKHHAPDSYAALRPGARPAAVAALESDLGVPIPLELRVLWTLTAGDDGAEGRGCLPGNNALLTLDAVAAVHRLKRDAQAQEDTRNAHRLEDERITVWKATWIPVVAFGPSDHTSGLYLDAATGYLGRWSRFNDAPDEELDTLVTYLEEAADMLEAPALATRDRPGLLDGALVWLSGIDPAHEERWRPVTG
jgi:cell wall assembly regulator SMI1